jgi:hypothetical protein
VGTKKVGSVLFIPALVFGVFVQHFDFYIDGFDLAVGTDQLFEKAGAKNNKTNELAGVLILISGFFVAFSREGLKMSLLVVRGWSGCNRVFTSITHCCWERYFLCTERILFS